MQKISVLLADDHTVVRQGLRALLEAEEDMSVVGEAENGRQAVNMAKRLQPDVVVDVSEQFETIVDMLACHESQFFEWLPFNRGEEQVPSDPADRRAWLRAWYARHLRTATERWRERLVATYGPKRGGRIEFAEAYEISEYAAPLWP